MTTPALEFNDLHLAYMVRGHAREVLRGVSFAVRPGESYGLVGESGCGKSTAAYAAVRYLPRNARILSGDVQLGGRDVMSLDQHELREMRANNVSIVYQDPGQALNPSIKVGPQLMEAFTRSIPLGRIGQPDDLPGAILFFASSDAAFVTGQVISVSGGLTMVG